MDKIIDRHCGEYRFAEVTEEARHDRILTPKPACAFGHGNRSLERVLHELPVPLVGRSRCPEDVVEQLVDFGFVTRPIGPDYNVCHRPAPARRDVSENSCHSVLREACARASSCPATATSA